MSNNPHLMKYTGSDEEGFHYFTCPMCKRRFKLKWPPEYQMVVLQKGDDTAQHVGATMPGLEVRVSIQEKGDPYLAPFEDFLKGK